MIIIIIITDFTILILRKFRVTFPKVISKNKIKKLLEITENKNF